MTTGPHSPASSLATRTSFTFAKGVRTVVTFASFAMFVIGSFLLGLVILPLLFPFALFNIDRYRSVCTRLVARGFGAFLLWLRVVGILDYKYPELPAEVGDRSYVVVANHPTLIDVTFLLHSFPRLTSIVKWEWYNFGPFAPVLRSLHYIPGNGAPPPEGAATETPVLDRMVDHIQAGHALVCFPEGSRSLTDRLRRFRRGPFEAAVRAGVPLVVVFVDVDRAVLDKSSKFVQVPDGRARYAFEIVDVIETDPARGGETDAEALRVRVRDELAWRYEECLARRLPREASS